jgi:tight adherence protein B
VSGWEDILAWAAPSLLVFATVVLAAAGGSSLLADLWFSDSRRVSRRVDEEFLKRQRDRAKNSSLFKDLGKVAAELAAEEGPRLRWYERLDLTIEQSGLSLTRRQLFGVMASLGLIAAVGVGFPLHSLLAALAAAPVGAVLPYLYLGWKRKARLDTLLAQLPDAFEMMARMLRAGQTLPQALQLAARDFRPPLASEFAYCYEQQNLGLPPEAAYHDLARRAGLLEINLFVLTVLVQQQSGGNVADLLDNLAETVRERLRTRTRLKTLTAEGRLQAVVLQALPPGLFVVMWFLKRSYVEKLFDHPWLLAGFVVAQVIAAVWIRRVTNDGE